MLLDGVIGHLDRTLEIQLFRDYGPNGLQVEARGNCEVERVVTGVSANLALIEAAVERRAELLIVHHGLLWGPGLERVTGNAARRLAALFRGGVSLAAYHLPLDRHPRLGNNAGLADALGLAGVRHAFGPIRGVELGVAVDVEPELGRDELVARVRELVRGAPPFVFAHGPETIRRVGLCTGAASDLLEQAAAFGCDAYVTGELAERAAELARELGVTLIAAGHHATEVYGPRRLVDELAVAFPGLEASFVDIPSPL